MGNARLVELALAAVIVATAHLATRREGWLAATVCQQSALCPDPAESASTVAGVCTFEVHGALCDVGISHVLACAAVLVAVGFLATGA